MTAWLLAATMLGQMTLSPDGALVPMNPLFQDKGTPWVAPGRLFLMKIPKGWAVALHDNDPYTVDFRAVGKQGDAVLQVRRIRVPKGAHPRQIMLNAIERRLEKMPNFQIVSKRNVVMSGSKGAALLARYAYQGNLQFPKILEEVYVVVGTEAFIFHFECFEPAAGNFAADLNIMYESFQARPPGATDGPFATPVEKPQKIDTSKIPF